MIRNKTIALIAHDARKSDMVEWVTYNAKTLLNNIMICTGTTGTLIEDTLNKEINYMLSKGEITIRPTFIVKKMKSGPLGGDAQIAAKVVEGEIDLCIFLIDDLTANPHEADIMMLLRQCRIHNIPVACNRHSADLMVTSDLWGTRYTPTIPTYTKFDRINAIN